jgi:hypothetical protein
MSAAVRFIACTPQCGESLVPKVLDFGEDGFRGDGLGDEVPGFVDGDRTASSVEAVSDPSFGSGEGASEVDDSRRGERFISMWVGDGE